MVIGTSGAVTSVKIKTSTLPSNEATSACRQPFAAGSSRRPVAAQSAVIYPIALASSGT